MIVECENCSTRFQLDDERIPISGIRVRCSRCKQAFFLKHPGASEPEAVDAVAAEALEEAAAAAPEPATDLAGSSLEDMETFDASSVLDDEEDDWEFNHDVPDEGPEDDGKSDVRPGFDTGSPSGLELAGGEAEIAQSVRDPGASGAFGSVDDFGALSDDPPEVPTSVSQDDVGDDPIGDTIDSFSPGEQADAPAAQPAPDSEVASDLGEPEDWDLLGEDLSLPEAEPSDRNDAVSAQARPVVAAKEPDSQVAVASSAKVSRRSMPGVWRAGSALGWLVFAALFAATLVQGLTRSSDATTVNTSYSLGALRADSVAMHWTRVGGGETLLVVTGALHNPTSSPLPLGASVAVELLDARGGRLEHPPALAGRPLGENALRTLDPVSRAARQAAAAAALSRERISPGGDIPFAAYFASLPADARRFRIGRAETGAPREQRVEQREASAPALEAAPAPAATGRSSRS